MCLGAGAVPPGGPHEEDQSRAPGKHVQAKEVGRCHRPLQEDHRQPCAQKEKILFDLVVGLSLGYPQIFQKIKLTKFDCFFFYEI